MAETKVKDRKFTVKEYVQMALGKPVYLGEEKREGWKEPIPVYAFKCPVHGIVVSRVYGYKARLDCPYCKNRGQSEELPDGLDYKFYPSKEHEGL